MEPTKMVFQIAGVSEESFGYQNNEGSDISKIKEIEVEVTHLYKWNADQKMFGVFFNIRLRAKNNEVRNVLLYFDCAVHFKIDNFSDVIEAQPELFINKSAEITLVSISYSTIRGMLATRTMGTPLSHFILPIVEPAILIESRIKSEANKKGERSQ